MCQLRARVNAADAGAASVCFKGVRGGPAALARESRSGRKMGTVSRYGSSTDRASCCNDSTPTPLRVVHDDLFAAKRAGGV